MGVLIIIAILLIIILVIYNNLVKARNKVKQAESGIDVYLNQRFDLIPNLVECVKGYMKHESDTFAKVAEMRSKFSESKDLKTGSELNSEFNKLMAVGENNPNLQASEQFLNLQKNLSKMESQLQAARRVYNGDVTLYNTTISTIPSNIVASLFGFKEEELFEMEEYKILKASFLSDVDIVVKYKSDPAYEYHYYYPLCNIGNNLPMFVIIYSGNVSIGSENHSLVKYPPVSRK